MDTSTDMIIFIIVIKSAAILDLKKCHQVRFCTPYEKCNLRVIQSQINRQKESVLIFPPSPPNSSGLMVWISANLELLKTTYCQVVGLTRVRSCWGVFCGIYHLLKSEVIKSLPYELAFIDHWILNQQILVQKMLKHWVYHKTTWVLTGFFCSYSLDY